MRLLVLLSLLGTLTCHANLVDRINRIIPVLETVESQNDPNKVGDHGRAVGLLQQHPSYREDVNRIYGTSYTKQDSYDPNKAREITFFYLLFYGTQYENKGRSASFEVLAKIHNGGPVGYIKRATNKYWKKVRLLL